MIRKWNQTNYKNNEPCLCQNVDFMQSFNKHTDTYKMKTWNNFKMLWFFFLNVACAVHRFRTFFLGPHSPQTYHFRRDSNPQFVKGLKIEQNWELNRDNALIRYTSHPTLYLKEEHTWFFHTKSYRINRHACNLIERDKTTCLFAR